MRRLNLSPADFLFEYRQPWNTWVQVRLTLTWRMQTTDPKIDHKFHNVFQKIQINWISLPYLESPQKMHSNKYKHAWYRFSKSWNRHWKVWECINNYARYNGRTLCVQGVFIPVLLVCLSECWGVALSLLFCNLGDHLFLGCKHVSVFRFTVQYSGWSLTVGWRSIVFDCHCVELVCQQAVHVGLKS